MNNQSLSGLSIDLSELIEYIKLTPQATNSTDIKKLISDCGDNFKQIFNSTYSSILQHIKSKEEDLANSEISNIFTLLETTEEKLDVFSKEFFSQIEINNHDLFEAFVIHKNEQKEYVKTLVNAINKKEALKSFSEYRESPQARKDCVSRVEKRSGEFFDYLLNNFLPKEKAEILARFEAYIEADWFDKDYETIWASYFNGEKTKEALYIDIKTRFGELFKKCSIKEHKDGYLTNYDLEISDQGIGYENAFSCAKSGYKDVCIKDVNGNYIIVDATKDETGEKQYTACFDTQRAIQTFENRTGVKCKHYVVIPSLFYDTEFNDEKLKSDFREKLNLISQDQINHWHFIQFIASLDRESPSPNYDLTSLFKNISFKQIGSQSGRVWENIKSLNGDKFKQNIVEILKSALLDIQTIDEEVLLTTKGMSGTNESKVLHLLISALKGVQLIIGDDNKLCEQYEGFSPLVDTLISRFESHSHQIVEAIRVSETMENSGSISRFFQKIQNKNRETSAKQEQYLEQKKLDCLKNRNYQ